MKRELCAVAHLALHTDISPMGAHDTLRDGQSQPRAACSTVARPRSIASIKALKDMWDILSRDSLACVAHGYFHAVICFPGVNPDLTTRGGVPQRVANQVIEHTPNGLCIHENGIDLRLNLPLQFDAFAIC